ncbi:hypothetical protein QTN25_002108 [Entamoeba marina]
MANVTKEKLEEMLVNKIEEINDKLESLDDNTIDDETVVTALEDIILEIKTSQSKVNELEEIVKAEVSGDLSIMLWNEKVRYLKTTFYNLNLEIQSVYLEVMNLNSK